MMVLTRRRARRVQQVADRHRVALLLWVSTAPFVIPMVILILWQALAMLNALPGYLTSPGAIVQSFLVELRSGDLLQHIQASMYRIVVGYAIGATVGVMLGLLSGTSRLLESFFDPLVAIAYPVPKIIFLPIFMVWVGIGDPSKVLTIATSVFFPVFINAYQGA